jgi:hypothetical protein
MQQTVFHLSLRGAQRRSNPSSWIAAPSFLGLAMTMEDVKYAGQPGFIFRRRQVSPAGRGAAGLTARHSAMTQVRASPGAGAGT